MKSNLYTFYNETYFKEASKNSIISGPEAVLATTLQHLHESTVATNGRLEKLKDQWNLKFYEGGGVPKYNNVQKGVPLIDFDKVHLISELQKDKVGIRFFTSILEDEIVIDIVKYKKDVSHTDPANLELRAYAPMLRMLCPAGIVDILKTAHDLTDSNDVINYIVQN